jgi:tetratricopeptide (TPR) repeat protein
MILCQNCKAPNHSSRESCARCGTRLLITTQPRGAAYGEVGATFEEHLLERISTLEYEVTRARQQQEQLLELVHRQATTSFYDHALLEAIVAALDEVDAVPASRVQANWRDLITRYSEELNQRERLEQRVRDIIGSFAGSDAARFGQLVAEGTRLLFEGNAGEGVRCLERAALEDPRNAPLTLFLGEHYFFSGRRVLARRYLELTVQHDEPNRLAALMLGVVCGDDGDTESAKAHFEGVLRRDAGSFAAHYGLGRLSIVEGRMGEALSHFKRALSASPSAEMHYLVGRAYLEQGRTKSAARHLRKALDLDPCFDPALYQLGLIYLNGAETERARECFRAASNAKPDERRYRAAVNATSPKQVAALPVFGRGRVSRKLSITSGDVRFTNLLMESLAHEAADPGSHARNR